VQCGKTSCGTPNLYAGTRDHDRKETTQREHLRAAPSCPQQAHECEKCAGGQGHCTEQNRFRGMLRASENLHIQDSFCVPVSADTACLDDKMAAERITCSRIASDGDSLAALHARVGWTPARHSPHTCRAS